jgi:hypothetical protein
MVKSIIDFDFETPIYALQELVHCLYQFLFIYLLVGVGCSEIIEIASDHDYYFFSFVGVEYKRMNVKRLSFTLKRCHKYEWLI